MENEPHITIKRVENGACDTVRLDYYQQYAPGYQLTVTTHVSQRNRFTTEYWLHDIADAIALFNALEKVATSRIAPAGEDAPEMSVEERLRALGY